MNSGKNLYVITGGPGAGKTTVLRELEQQGLGCALEVARQMIQEQVRDGGTALPWADRILYHAVDVGTVRSGIQTTRTRFAPDLFRPWHPGHSRVRSADRLEG